MVRVKGGYVGVWCHANAERSMCEVLFFEGGVERVGWQCGGWRNVIF